MAKATWEGAVFLSSTTHSVGLSQSDVDRQNVYLSRLKFLLAKKGGFARTSIRSNQPQKLSFFLLSLHLPMCSALVENTVSVKKRVVGGKLEIWNYCLIWWQKEEPGLRVRPLTCKEGQAGCCLPAPLPHLRDGWLQCLCLSFSLCTRGCLLASRDLEMG